MFSAHFTSLSLSPPSPRRFIDKVYPRCGHAALAESHEGVRQHGTVVDDGVASGNVKHVRFRRVRFDDCLLDSVCHHDVRD